MNNNLARVSVIDASEWERLRDIRLRSLLANPDAFGGKFESENLLTQEDWQARIAKSNWLIASADGLDVALMSVEVLEGDHGATCWIGGCWSDPKYRGTGAFRRLFEFLDVNAPSKGWERQGLGVWADNSEAIGAYKALGFEFAGEIQPSARQPDRFYVHMVRNSK